MRPAGQPSAIATLEAALRRTPGLVPFRHVNEDVRHQPHFPDVPLLGTPIAARSFCRKEAHYDHPPQPNRIESALYTMVVFWRPCSQGSEPHLTRGYLGNLVPDLDEGAGDRGVGKI